MYISTTNYDHEHDALFEVYLRDGDKTEITIHIVHHDFTTTHLTLSLNEAKSLESQLQTILNEVEK